METFNLSVDLGVAKYAYPVAKMCAWLDVSKSGFFDWKKRPTSATAEHREELAILIEELFEITEQTYGYRRMHAQLARLSVHAGPELVRHIMRDLHLVPCQPRPWRHNLTSSDGREHAIPDRLAQDFTAPVPGRKLIGDITYIPTWDGWLYLATVIDCHTKMVIGYAMADHYKTPLISAALHDAATKHALEAKAIFHSDRGSNYTSYDFAKTITELDMRQSMGRTGICYDNAMAESFFAVLKHELVHRTEYPTRAHAQADITNYIDNWYNPLRLHSGLAYRSPKEALDDWTNTQAAA